MIQIEKGIEIPAKRRFGGSSRVYPWREMEVGDSFFVEATDPRSRIKALAVGACWAGKRFGRKYTCRTVSGGVRCWRTA